VIAKKILGIVLAHPLDGGIALADGQSIFGHSKTIRGIVLSIIVTTLGTPWIGLDWTAGLVVGQAPLRSRLYRHFLGAAASGCVAGDAVGGAREIFAPRHHI
jgi:hypothetical protein